MFSVGKLIDDVAVDVSSASFAMPTLLADISTGLSPIYKIWYGYKWVKVALDASMSTSEKIGKSTLGRGLNLAFGDAPLSFANAPIIAIAHLTLVASSIFEYMHAKQHVHKTYRIWLEAVNSTYSISCIDRSSPLDSKVNSIFSLSTINSLQLAFARKGYWIHRVSVASLQLLSALFNCYGCFMYAIMAFSFSKQTRQESLQSFAFNYRYAINELVQDNFKLLEKIRANQKILDAISLRLNLPFNAKHCITIISGVMQAAKSLSSASQKISDVADGSIKKMLCSFVYTFTGIVPEALLPIKELEQKSKNEFKV